MKMIRHRVSHFEGTAGPCAPHASRLKGTALRPVAAASNPHMPPIVFPAWDDIKPVPGMRHGCMWGFFDRDGVKDNIGSEVSQTLRVS